MKRRMNLEPGKKYRGYGFLNEFGEFEFIPEQTGSRQGSIKHLKVAADYTLSESRNKILVYVRLDRAKGMRLIASFLRVVNFIVFDLRSYEI